MSRETAYQKFTGQQAPPAATSLDQVKERIQTNAQQPTQQTTEQATPSQTTTQLDSSRLALLAKKEAALQKEREALKKEREEWLNKDKAEADKVLARAKEFNELSQKDKIAALRLIGWSETDIFNALAGMEKTEPTAEEIAKRVAQEEAQKIRDELKQQAEDAEKTTNARLIENLRSDLSSEIKQNVDKYELSSFEGKDAENLAYEFIVETLKESGELLSPTEAMEMTEAFYEERNKARAKLKKLQPAQPETTQAPPSEQMRGRTPVSNVPQPEQQAKTVERTRVIPPPPAGRRESHAEKRERLIKAIQTGGLTR